MQQFPNNQSFYNDPTQYQPYAPPPPPGQKPLPHERLIRWFKARNKFAQVGIGCLSLLVICTMCGIFNAIAKTTNTPQDAPTTPAKVATHAVATATDVKPAATSEPTPTPKPTATPQPTPKTAPAPASAPAATDTPAPPPSCYPLTNSGNCYEPGEYCRTADHGASGIAGDGKSITCTYNDGWRWEPKCFQVDYAA